ncbi:MAG TPA: hypothetical protein VFK34_10050 [Marmoricola sp.]|jgi:hypothetical protein|nr:hypothetical protein [Marmoricola sp.]
MSLSMKYLFTVALLAGLFEAVSVFLIAQPLLAGGFAAVFLVCAWALATRQSRIATVVVGLFLLVDVGGVPFYARDGLGDLLVQLAFALIGIVGIAACVVVLRGHRVATAADAPQ